MENIALITLQYIQNLPYEAIVPLWVVSILENDTTTMSNLEMGLYIPI